jgi:type I restriction enzyme S subunit
MTTIGKKTDYASMFTALENALYHHETIVGEDALYIMTMLVAFVLIEPHIENGTIAFDDVYDWCFFDECHNEEEHHLKLDDLVPKTKYSTMVQINPDDLHKNFEDVFYLLSRHPKTKDIFSSSLGFKKREIFKTIFSIFKEFSFAVSDADILGDAYEAMKKKCMKNKMLGQFFTPTDIKEFLIQEICPQRFSDGSCETFFDPTMGTGGFLLSAINHLKRQQSGQELDIEFIKSNIGGNEIHDKTFRLANANFLISTGHLYEKFKLKDTIRDEPDETKYDIVLANPPFGMKIKKEEVKKDYLPIETTGTFLFIQSIIYYLKIGGRAVVVLPWGKEIFGKDKDFVNCRETLLKSCDLQKVILFPAGMFSNTGIKTCAFIFYKRKDMLDVLKPTKKRKYDFITGHATSSVEWLQYNVDTKDATHLVQVSIDQIEKKSYSLDFSSYIEKVGIQVSSNSAFEVKTLGEVCEFRRGQNLTKANAIEGPYPVIAGGKTPNGFHNAFNREPNTILCSSSGASSGYISRYTTSVWASDCFSIHSTVVSEDYIYYFLKFKQEDIYSFQRGGVIPHVNAEQLGTIEIPVPSLERQLEIVQGVETLNELRSRIEKGWVDKIAEVKMLTRMEFDTRFGKFEVKTLGEVCELKTGQDIDKKSLKGGIYPVIGGGETPIGYHDTFNVSENTIIVSNAGKAGYVSKSDKKAFVHRNAYYVKDIIEPVVSPDYLYYLLKNIQNEIYSLQHGTCQPNISKMDLLSLQIPVPPLERQLEIVDYCLKSSALIASLEEEMERNKVQMSRYLSSLFSF